MRPSSSDSIQGRWKLLFSDRVYQPSNGFGRASSFCLFCWNLGSLDVAWAEGMGTSIRTCSCGPHMGRPKESPFTLKIIHPETLLRFPSVVQFWRITAEIHTPSIESTPPLQSLHYECTIDQRLKYLVLSPNMASKDIHDYVKKNGSWALRGSIVRDLFFFSDYFPKGMLRYIAGKGLWFFNISTSLHPTHWLGAVFAVSSPNPPSGPRQSLLYFDETCHL